MTQNFLILSLSAFLFSCSSMNSHYLQVEKEMEEGLKYLSYELLSDEDRREMRDLDSKNIDLEEGFFFMSNADVKELAVEIEDDFQSEDFLSDVFLNTFSLSSVSEVDLGLRKSLSQSFTNSGDRVESGQEEDLRHLKPFIQEEFFELPSNDPSELSKTELSKRQKFITLKRETESENFQVFNELNKQQTSFSVPAIPSLQGIRWSYYKNGKMKIILESDQKINYKTQFDFYSGEIFIDLEKAVLSEELKQKFSNNKNIRLYEIPSKKWARVIILRTGNNQKD